MKIPVFIEKILVFPFSLFASFSCQSISRIRLQKEYHLKNEKNSLIICTFMQNSGLFCGSHFLLLGFCLF